MGKRCYLTDRDKSRLARFKRLVAILSVSLAASISAWYDIEHTILKEELKHMTPQQGVNPISPPLVPVVKWLSFTERVCHAG